MSLEFAQELIRHGVPVFVARRATEWPAGGTHGCGYHLPSGWQSTPASEASLASWRHGDALCAVGGHGIDFVDVDPRHGGDTTWRTITESGVDVDIYAVVATVSGEGRHYYVGDLAMRSREDSTGIHGHKGIDVRAGTSDAAGRGFVWLPGVERVNKDGEIATYRLLDNALHEHDGDGGRANQLRDWFASREPKVTADDIWGDKAKDNELGVPVEDGMHDRAGARFAARLAALGMRWEYARVLIMERVKDFVDTDPRDPFTEADARRWWRGAVLKFAPPEAADTVDLTDHESVKARFPALSWAALFEDTSEQEWLLKPLLPAGRGVAIFSEPKMGKSLVMLEIAAALATGRDVLGWRPVRPVHVLYVDHENDPLGDTRDRLRLMGFTPDDERLARLHMLSFPAFAPLDTARGGEELLAAAKAYGAELVIIDTMSRTISGPENDNDTTNAWYRFTGKALKSNGVAYVRLDHTGHAGTHARGGSAKAGDVDMVWHLKRGESKESFVLNCTHTRVRILEDSIALDRRDEPLRHVVIAGGASREYSLAVRDVMDSLRHLPSDATRSDVEEAAGKVEANWAKAPSAGEKDRRGVIKKAWDYVLDNRLEA